MADIERYEAFQDSRGEETQKHLDRRFKGHRYQASDMEQRLEALGKFSCDIRAFRRATFVRSLKRYVCHQI